MRREVKGGCLIERSEIRERSGGLKRQPRISLPINPDYARYPKLFFKPRLLAASRSDVGLKSTRYGVATCGVMVRRDRTLMSLRLSGPRDKNGVRMTATTDWLTAIGTCGAVAVSLGLSIIELRSRGRREERRQAEQITAWYVPYEGTPREDRPMDVGLRINNGSNQLVYDLVAECLLGRKTAVGDTEDMNLEFGALIGNVPPGGYTGYINTSGGALGRRHGLEFAFQDAAGRYWLRRANGKLERAYKHPLELFNLPRGERYQITLAFPAE